MNKTWFKVSLASVFLVCSTFANANLIVTLGDVTGNNTNLSVSISGSGTLQSDLWDGGNGNLNIFDDFLGNEIEDSDYVGFVGDQVPFFADNNIGGYVDDAYNSFTAELLASTITLFNLTDDTSAEVKWLNIDHDGATTDDFALILDSKDNSLFDSGDQWLIGGSSTLVLQRGDASDFNLGTYTYSDNAIGDVTLVIQAETAPTISTSIPEPASLALIVLGMFGLRRARIA